MKCAKLGLLIFAVLFFIVVDFWLLMIFILRTPVGF